MQRTALSSAIVAVALLAGTTSASAANLSGQWTAKVSSTGTIQLALSAHGSGYTGTYTYILTYVVSKQTKVSKSSQPVTADYKVVNKIPTLVLHLTKLKPVVSINCAFIKSQLQCISPATQKALSFTHTKG